MFATMGRSAPLLATLMLLGAPTPAWAGRALALTPDDNLGLLALVAGLLAFWLYFRATTEDQA